MHIISLDHATAHTHTFTQIVFIEHGAPLRADEVALKFYLYDETKETKAFATLCELPVRVTARVAQVKQQLLAHLAAKAAAKAAAAAATASSSSSSSSAPVAAPVAKPIEFVRLREKSGAKVGKIFIDEQSVRAALGANTTTDGREIAVQRLRCARGERASENQI